MLAVPAAAASKIPHLPESPGVYLWKDADGRVLYVGKAKRLRSRVRSYFAGDGQIGVKTEFMLRQVADVDTIVVPTEAHALILEANLIKEYRPRFNIALRDDKSYPFIAISLDEDYPRVYFTRERHRPGRAYFGPYSSAKRVRSTLEVLATISS